MIPALRRTALYATVLMASAIVPAWTAEPAPAVVRRVEVGAKMDDKANAKNAFSSAFVLNESLDGIEFLVDDPKGTNKLSFKRGTYAVEYDLTKDIDLLTGINARDAGNWEKSAAALAKAVTANRLNVLSSEWALRYGAESLMRAGKLDEALATVAQLEKTAPRSLLLVETLVVKGQVLQAKGDIPGATKVYADLVARAKDFGNTARVRGLRGQATLHTAAKQPVEAAKLLASLLATLDAAKDGNDYADTALELLNAQIAAGQSGAALATASTIAYQMSEPSDLAQVQLLWAKLLSDQSATASQLEAFDHAAMAAGVKNVPQATYSAAVNLARSLSEKLQKDASLSAQDKLELRKSAEAL